MTEADVWAAFDAAFLDLAGIGNKYTADQIVDPGQQAPYSRATMPALSRTPLGFGADAVIQFSGTYQVLVSCPQGSGRNVCMRMGDVVSAAFPRGRAITFTALDTGTNHTVSVMISHAQPPMTNGDWISVPVLIEWMGTDP